MGCRKSMTVYRRQHIILYTFLVFIAHYALYHRRFRESALRRDDLDCLFAHAETALECCFPYVVLYPRLVYQLWPAEACW